MKLILLWKEMPEHKYLQSEDRFPYAKTKLWYAVPDSSVTKLDLG